MKYPLVNPVGPNLVAFWSAVIQAVAGVSMIVSVADPHSGRTAGYSTDPRSPR
ncbi:hypothetical protein FRUB_03897 [Fimbriiglobus ruber]|uniref:Uncharacterized protein n=1 Tax=Fimbriiglobus ruber TaxID=1908690 RepID=A0A225DXA0_9BACT|nr:hypothetical protein FRUB_03897 [Fimbriiglobus ruber]